MGETCLAGVVREVSCEEPVHPLWIPIPKGHAERKDMLDLTVGDS